MGYDSCGGWIVSAAAIFATESAKTKDPWGLRTCEWDERSSHQGRCQLSVVGIQLTATDKVRTTVHSSQLTVLHPWIQNLLSIGFTSNAAEALADRRLFDSA